MSANVPPDIWLYIAQFIPYDDIYHQFRTINSTFFHLAMDMRYGEVCIEYNAASPNLCIVDRLSDPFVARKVKRLKLDFTEYYLETVTDGTAAPSTRINQAGNIMRKLFDRMSFSKSSPSARQPPQDPLDAIISCLSKLHNTITLEIVTNFQYDSNGSLCIPSKFGNVLSLAWSTFGGNLQSLSIKAEAAAYREISSAKPYLRNLGTLRIYYAGPLPESETGPRLNALVPFINNISPALKQLSVTFFGFRYVPEIFSFLSTSIILEQFQVTLTPFPCRRTWDSSGLQTFLCDGAHTLRDLDLDFQTGSYSTNGYHSLSKLLRNCAADEMCFSRLRTLKINPTNGPAGINALCAAVRRASNTLEDLVIYDSRLSRDATLVVVDALSGCAELRSLRLQIISLDIKTVDSMAESLPGLRYLDLWHDAYEGDETRNDNPFQLIRDLERFETYCYPQWKLEDISIYFTRGAMVDVMIMKALARAVPSIKSFCGRGHMREIEKEYIYRPRLVY